MPSFIVPTCFAFVLANDGVCCRLHVANYVAVVVFTVSMCSVIRVWDGALNRMNYFRLAVPFFFVFASMTYLFGFFGISIISGVMDPPFAFPASPSNDTNSLSTAKASANRATTDRSGHRAIRSASDADASSYSLDTPEVVIVGAGTAGASAAITLARQGRKVLLVEKCMEEQDRIVGELLQPGGLRALERLGLDACAKEGTDSVVVDGYAIITAARDAADHAGCDTNTSASNNHSSPSREGVMLYYPETDPENRSEFFGKGVTPTSGVGAVGREHVPRGRSFHNGRFVQRLREVAASEPNIRMLEATVLGLLEGNDGEVVGVRYRESAKESEDRMTREVRAPLTVVADGIWSGLRKCANSNRPQHISSFVGVLVTHPAHAAPVPHKYCGHVVLADPSPILIYQISSTETRVLVDIAGPMPSAAKGELSTFLRERSAPQLPKEFRPAFLAAVNRGDVKSMPNRAMPASNVHREGALLVGDALNMRHPLTGGGMTVAIKVIITSFYCLRWRIVRCHADVYVMSTPEAPWAASCRKAERV